MGVATIRVLTLVFFLVGISHGLPGRDGYKNSRFEPKYPAIWIQPIVKQKTQAKMECVGSVMCNNGECATPCNGIKECPYGEDEKRCKDQCEVLPDCKDKDELICPDKTTCASVCDGKKECFKDEDETMCIEECKDDELMCGTGDGCGKPCDGIIQCEDKSDEQACPCDSVAITKCLCGIIHEVDSDEYHMCLSDRSDDVFKCCRLDAVNIAAMKDVFRSPEKMEACVGHDVPSSPYMDRMLPFRDFDKCILSL